MSKSGDRAFIPFNFSSVISFDPIAAALNELPKPQLTEPEGEFSSFARDEIPTEQPSRADETEMLQLMTDTARDGDWGHVNENYVQTQRRSVSRLEDAWVTPFCDQLSAKLRHSEKRPTSVQLSPKRQTPKRPRPSPIRSAPPPGDMSPVTRRMARSPSGPSEKRRLALRPEVTHEREMRIQQMSKDVDMDEFNEFVDYLERFVRRPAGFARKTDDIDEGILLVTASENVLIEIRQKVLLVVAKGGVAYAKPELLAKVIAILHRRIYESSKMCRLAERAIPSKGCTAEAILGLLAAATVLAIICAPGSPRKLLVEELLDEIVQLLRSCATYIVFPLCDPLYKASKASERKRKNRKNAKSSSRHSRGESVKDTDSPDRADVECISRPSTSRSTLSKKDEALLDNCCATLDAMTDLFAKERHLPDTVVSHTASLCIQSLSVTGIARLQSHAMKTACMIFNSYPVHRMSMLDDVREAASIIPAARRHLRCFRLPEDQAGVRVSSALLAQLLCIASDDPDATSITNSKRKPPENAKEAWTTQRKQRHDRAAKLGMHVLDPLLKRACSDREVEYRTAFQSLFEDILTLYGRPEWPSAELMLQTISVSIITRLRAQEEKSVYARCVSVDLLGALAGKMCELYGGGVLKESEEGTSFAVLVDTLEASREEILIYLDPERSLQFAASNSFYEALFVCDDFSVASNLEKRSKKIVEERNRCDGTTAEDVLDGQDGSLPIEGSVHEAVETRASSRAKRVADRRLRSDEVTRAAAVSATRHVGRNRSFTAGFRTILEAILDGMHDPAPTVRAKSIKALSTVDEACHGLLRAVPDVLKYIEAGCRDVSTLTRDAALELLSRSLLQKGSRVNTEVCASENLKSSKSEGPEDPGFIFKIFTIVEKRLSDTATSVRKRAIAIMRAVLSNALQASENLRGKPMNAIEALRDMQQHEAKIIQVCASLVGRLDDPESTVREAAERTLRLGLFGFDISQQLQSSEVDNTERAVQLASRFVTVFARLPSNIHVSFVSRVVHKAMLVKHRPLVASIVTATVEQMHDHEANMAKVSSGRGYKSLSEIDLNKMRTLSIRRVACSSVICAFGVLDPSLVIPHCRSLAPSIKDVNELGTSDSDLVCVQRVLNILEVGFRSSEVFDATFLEEVMHDIEVIVCTSPISILEEAAVKCLCVISRNPQIREEGVLEQAATTFRSFLNNQLNSLREYCTGPMPERPTSLERNARGALVRLGLLLRYGDFRDEFVQQVYRTIENVCDAVTVEGKRDFLSRASVRALSHFLIRHRSFLTSGTQVFVSVLEKSGRQANVTDTSLIQPISYEGMQLSVLQGFHELLRDEEERNSAAKETSRHEEGRKISRKDEDKATRGTDQAEKGNNAPECNDSPGDVSDKPVLAAEEDAEAGFLALSAQALIPSLKRAVHSASTAVRRTAANILGLLVRQGLLLPATVVTELFSLMLDRDTRCREFSCRVIAFLADRHSGMLASAALPALRVCFQNSFFVHCAVGIGDAEAHGPAQGGKTCGNGKSENQNITTQGRSRVPSIEEIAGMTTDERTGHSLLSQAVMTMRREQRRGVLESVMREFDPRVVVRVQSPTENSNDTRIHDDDFENKCPVRMDIEQQQGFPKKSESGDDDDDIGHISMTDLDILGADPKCPLPTLYFLAMTLASLDYTDGAGIGGSLTQGGGTAAADTKLKYAKEDVTDLVATATRIISNSGQAILRVTKQLQRSKFASEERKVKVASYASRMCVLLFLKHHLKVERWKSLMTSDDTKEESEVTSSSCRMPSFHPDGSGLKYASWKPGDLPLLTVEAADHQLDLFCRLMRHDAIDDADIAVTSRKGSRSAKNRASSRRTIAKQPNRKTTTMVGPSPKRPVLHRRASAAKKLRYDEDSDDGSDYDPANLH